MNRFKMLPNQQGQTLIETMVAIFILVMGLTAALGLAIYALSTSTNITKQIIATGLAREGVEAVKNMRDTNWLNDTLAVNQCYDYVTSSSNKADCYLGWLSKSFCIDPTNNSGSDCNGKAITEKFFLGIDPTSSIFWDLQKQHSAGEINFGLNFNQTDASGAGYYTTGSSGVACPTATSEYCRKIVITKDYTSPYLADPNGVGPQLKVSSRVWWADKKCVRIDDWDETAAPPKIPDPRCRIELQMYLTNWKNY